MSTRFSFRLLMLADVLTCFHMPVAVSCLSMSLRLFSHMFHTLQKSLHFCQTSHMESLFIFLPCSNPLELITELFLFFCFSNASLVSCYQNFVVVCFRRGQLSSLFSHHFSTIAYISILPSSDVHKRIYHHIALISECLVVSYLGRLLGNDNKRGV